MAVAVDFDFLKRADEVIAAGEEDFLPAAGASFEVDLVAFFAFDEDFDFGAEQLFLFFGGHFVMQS